MFYFALPRTWHKRNYAKLRIISPFLQEGLYGVNLAKTKILAKENTITQGDRQHGATQPAHAARAWEERKRFSVT
jgi:hypothetical protein